MTRRLFPLLLAGVLALAACGGSGGDPEVASIDGGGDSAAATDDADDEAATPEEAEEAFAEFAECMREHGVDMPDPEFRTEGGGGGGEGGVITFGGPDAGERVATFDDEEFQAAQEACGDILDGVVRAGPGEIDPEQEAEMRDRALAFAECMREHGVDMPDPQFGEGGMVNQMLGEGLDPSSDEFQDAQDACADEMGGGPFVGSGPIARSEEG